VKPKAKDLTVVGNSSLKNTYTTVHTKAILNLNPAANITYKILDVSDKSSVF